MCCLELHLRTALAACALPLHPLSLPQGRPSTATTSSAPPSCCSSTGEGCAVGSAEGGQTGRGAGPCCCVIFRFCDQSLGSPRPAPDACRSAAVTLPPKFRQAGGSAAVADRGDRPSPLGAARALTKLVRWTKQRSAAQRASGSRRPPSTSGRGSRTAPRTARRS